MTIKNKKRLLKRFPIASQLNETERTMLNNMINFEKEKVRVVLNKTAADKAITDASFIRELIVKEYKRRTRQSKTLNK